MTDRAFRLGPAERWILLMLAVAAREGACPELAAEHLDRVLRSECVYAAAYDATFFAAGYLRGPAA